MFLTDSTELHPICGGKVVAVAEPGKVARFAPAHDVFTCNWLVDGGYTEDGDRWTYDCGAVAVGFDNGFMCVNGHSHFTNAEYFERDEMESAHRHGNLPANARLV